MGVIFESGYTLPGSDQPLTHARIAHSGNWYSGTPAASSTATGYFASAPNNSLTYETWQPSSLPATWELDLGSAQDVDYCCIAAHDMGDNGNSLQVQYYDGSAWQDIIGATAISDNMPIFAIFATENRQRFRIRITNGTAPTIGVIRFGEAMQMERPLYGGHAPMHMARQTVMRSNVSGTGEFLGRTKQRAYLQTAFAWNNLTADWVRSNWRPFQIACETEPFFIAWRPITFSEVAYGYVDSVPIPQNTGVRNLMSVEMTMRARSYD